MSTESARRRSYIPVKKVRCPFDFAKSTFTVVQSRVLFQSERGSLALNLRELEDEVGNGWL